jgi:TRAP-type C4-dicarboxylate transport system permease small subunit
MSAVERLRRWLGRALEIAVIVLMLALVAVVFLGVVYRKAGASLSWYDEVASVMLAWLTYYGAALAALRREHIGFSGIVDWVDVRLRLVMVAVGEIFIFAFFILLAWYGVKVLVVLGGDALVSLPWVPTRFTQSVIPVGAALFVLAEALSLPQVWRQAKSSVKFNIGNA